jgi:2-polyprenyl-3-methyl-5-hydroxy-6-metoxy-1,4-benzoquinol methylase
MRYSLVEQEQRYQRLRTLGRAVDYAGRSFTDFDLRTFLQQVLPALNFAAVPPCALEYGTGTGAGACFLAALGFQVDAIDIAPTAIELARRFADEQGQYIHYEVQDICTYNSQGKCYDLVVDNFCLQRLVTNERRSQALAVVRRVLKPSGYFIIGTTIYQEDRQLPADEFCDKETGIVYRRLKPGTEWYEDLIVHGEELLYPRVKRVRPESLRCELQEAGFGVLYQEAGRVLCQTRKDGGCG